MDINFKNYEYDGAWFGNSLYRWRYCWGRPSRYSTMIIWKITTIFKIRGDYYDNFNK